MPIKLAGSLLVALVSVTFAQTAPAIKTGPEVGTPIPSFSAVDQHGVTRTSASVLGPQGALLVFFRSADW